MTTTRWSGQSSTSWGWIIIPSGTSMWPSERPMLTFLRIERPDQRDLAPQRGGGVDHLLDAVDVGGEARDDDAALGAAEHLLQVRADLALGRGEARPVGVGGVAAEQQHALGAELGQPRDVGGLAVDRGLVELVVAGQQHRARGRCRRPLRTSRGSSASCG